MTAAVAASVDSSHALTRERRDHPSLDIPWPYATVLVVAGFLVVAVALLVTAWGGASRQADPRDQVLWLNLAVLAVSVLGAGCAVWLLVGRRSVTARSRQAQQAIVLALGLDRGPDAVASATGLVTAAGLTRRHHVDCPLMSGRSPLPTGGELDSCGVCGS
ncbi:MAG: hypothetical protein JWO22_1187 [Frankiales bacterium]|nr:hypothetical protein [Frankiales bacterium]